MWRGSKNKSFSGVNRDTTGLVVQEILEVSVVERIQEQIVVSIDVIPQKAFSSVLHCTNYARLVNSFTTTWTILREESSALRLKTMSRLSLPRRDEAEIGEFTRALAEFRNDVAQSERHGFVVPPFHQQCDDLEARNGSIFARTVFLELSKPFGRTREAPTVEAQTQKMAFGRELGIPRPSLGCQPDALGSAYFGGRSSATAEREVIWNVREVLCYHPSENDYSFDALQAYCFGINLKL